MSEKRTKMNPTIENQLVGLDLSDESVIRESLGAELSRKNREADAKDKKDIPGGHNWNLLRKPLPAFVFGLVAALAMMGAARPDVLSSLVKRFKVGENTSIIQSGVKEESEITAILGDFAKDLESGKRYFTYNDYGGWAGAVPTGAAPYIKQFSSLSLAAAEVDYPLHVPKFSPETESYISKFRKAEIFPDGIAVLYFGLGPNETILVQKPVGNGFTMSSSTVVTTVSADGSRVQKGLEPNLEELEIAGKKVTWQIHEPGVRRNLGKWAKKFPDKVIGRFIWEADGKSFTLNGLLLTKEEGIGFIQSVQPIR